jgi:hypothetical protein
MDEPEKIFVLNIQVEHPTETVMNQLQSEIDTFAKNHGMLIRTQTRRVKYSHCRLCGVPRSFGTLSGVPPYRADECKPAYSQSCKRRQARGGWKATG